MKPELPIYIILILTIYLCSACQSKKSNEHVIAIDTTLSEEQEDSLLLALSNFLYSEPSNSNEVQLNDLVNYAMEHHIGIQYDSRGYYYAVKGGDPNKAVNWKDKVSVHYRGLLTTGEEFDSSYKRNRPYEFIVGAMIPGFNFGMMHLYEGSKGWFLLPSKLAYGEEGFGQKIQPNSPLIFEIDQVKIIEKNKK